MKLGNNLWEHINYDAKRLQVTEIGVGTSALDASQLKLSYSYGTTANNGDVLSQTISGPGFSVTQSFTYDELNRLSTSQEQQGRSVTWRETLAYDRYGNRRIEAGTTPAFVGANPLINSATNQISSMVNNQVTGYQYDGVGNMTAEPGHTYQYDAESRMVSYGGETPASYTYDGTGQRVKKVVGTGSLAVTTLFVYDAMGKLIAEYGTNTTNNETGTSYVTLDRLGSTRLLTQGVIAKGGQAAKARYDYLPFGAEISSSYGNRSQVAGYTPIEGIRQKYTGYERDTESGLDFAEARYYANGQGRFISADSVGGSAANPQMLNRYAYTGNNPVNNVDPSGHVFFGAQFNSSQTDGNGADFGYPDYAEAGMSQEMLEKYASMKDLSNQDRAAAVAKADAGLFELGNATGSSTGQGDAEYAHAPQITPCGATLPTDNNQQEAIIAIMHETGTVSLGQPSAGGEPITMFTLWQEAVMFTNTIANATVSENKKSWTDLLRSPFTKSKDKNGSWVSASKNRDIGVRNLNNAMNSSPSSNSCIFLTNVIDAVSQVANGAFRDDRFNRWAGRGGKIPANSPQLQIGDTIFYNVAPASGR